MAKRKRYHQSFSDRMHESQGARGSMIYEDHSAPSNLPREVIMREYPKQDYLVQGYQDNIVGIDMNHNGAIRGTRKQMSSKKY